MFRAALLSLALPILASSAAWSQEPATREEADRQRRDEKAKETKPYEPNGFEKAMDFAEDRAIFILDREGFHPKLGSLTTGSGFAYGLGFRDRDLFSNKGALEIWGASSVKRYWATEARITFPRLANNHLYLDTWASHRDYPQENFFGLGPDSDRDDRSDYAIRTNHFGGRVGVRPTARHLIVGGGIEYLEPRLGAGKNDKYPDIPDIFPPSEVPGLDTRADFLRSEAFIEVDYREPRYPRNGGFYRIDFSHYDDRTAGQFTFNRIDADLRQFVGFLAGRRVIAARLFVSTSDTRPARRCRSTSCRHSAGTTRCAAFANIGSADRTRSLPRVNTAGRSGAASTGRSSSMPARSPTAARTSISRISRPTTASGSASTPTTASSSASMPRSGARMANTYISSSAGSSKMAATRRLALAGLVGLLAAGAVALPRSAAPRFYPDDPLWTDDDRVIDASKAGSIEDTNGYDFVVNTFGHPGERRDVRALNVNTVDEVPDSSWFTNRIGRKALSAAEIAKGPDRSAGVSLEGWKVSGGKSAGVQPGFRMTDPEGQIYQIEVDPPSNPELASGAEIIGTAFYHAIGYNVVDVYLAESIARRW